MSPLIFPLLASLAGADELVLHSGHDPELLRARVVHLTGAQPDEVRVVEIDEHFSNAPVRIEPGELTPCEELVDLESLEESIDRARGAMAYLE